MNLKRVTRFRISRGIINAIGCTGGSTDWKWQNVASFAASFKRVHVGRVNWHDKLEYCDRLDVESVDASGFFREGDGPRSDQLVDFLSGHRRNKEQLQLLA